MINSPTDQQLKQTLAKMLPEKTAIIHCGKLHWLSKPEGKYLANEVLDTELLHLCWLVEEELDKQNFALAYQRELESVAAHKRTDKRGRWAVYHASWQQRMIALAKVKGIEIV